MAQYGYFQGGSGPSPIPANFGQLATQGSAALQQGIMNASKSIGDALKERSEKAKELKEEGELAKKHLTLKAKRNEGVLDGSGLTIAEIQNLTPQAAIFEWQAMQGDTKLQSAEANVRGAVASARGQENINKVFDDVHASDMAFRQSQSKGQGLSNIIAQQKIDKTDHTAGAMQRLSRGQSGFVSGSREELEAAIMMFPYADRVQLAEYQSLLAQSEGGPWRPEVIDVGGYKMMMTSPNSAQYVGDPPDQLTTKPGYQDIPDGEGSQGIWDGKKWTSIKHPDKEGARLSDFDYDNSGGLDEGELNDYKATLKGAAALIPPMFKKVKDPITKKEVVPVPKTGVKNPKGKGSKRKTDSSKPEFNMKGLDEYRKNKMQ